MGKVTENYLINALISEENIDAQKNGYDENIYKLSKIFFIFAEQKRTNLFKAIIGFKSRIVHGFRVTLRATLKPLIAGKNSVLDCISFVVDFTGF